MSKKVFVVDDPNVAREVEALLRSRGLSKQPSTQVSNRPPMGRPINATEDDSFPFLRRIQKPTPSTSSWRDGDTTMRPMPSPFPWRDGDTTVRSTPKRRDDLGISQELLDDLLHSLEHPSPYKRPYEMSCGTFTPPTPSARLFVNSGCGGFVAADAHDLAMGRQLYSSNGCGGFEPITPSYGGCGGMMTSYPGCGGRYTTPSYGGCGGTTYLSGC